MKRIMILILILVFTMCCGCVSAKEYDIMVMLKQRLASLISSTICSTTILKGCTTWLIGTT